MKKEITVSTSDPESGLFHKGEHKVEFAYTAHVACDKKNFILGVEVTPGNIHDSVVFDTVYDEVTKTFPEVETITVDAGYKTPWICKKIIEDGRNPSTPYKRPMSKKGFFYSHEYGLDKCIKINLEDNHITEKEVISITADVFESFLGAIYLDHGIDKAREFLKETVYVQIQKKIIFFYDYKSTLKEYGDAEEVVVEYELIDEFGMPHDKTFTMAALVDGEKLGYGTGKSKKEAEQLAAKETLEILGLEGK